MSIDPDALAASLERLAASATDASVTAALNQSIQGCVDVFGVTGSGLMLTDEHNILRYVASTDEPGRILEAVEAEYGQGPCTDSFLDNSPVATSDLATDPRWPATGAAVAPLGVHAVLGVPVTIDGIPVGSLDVYRNHTHDWDHTEQRALTRYSQLIEVTLAAALHAERSTELAEQLQYALDHRVVIERAIGFLMAQQQIDALEAFNRLRRTSRSTRRKIGDTAAELLATSRLPTDQDARPEW